MNLWKKPRWSSSRCQARGGNPWTAAVCSVLVLLFCGSWLGPRAAAEEAAYVGSRTCEACHEYEYRSFSRNARKAESFASVEQMRDGLTQEEIEGCYGCHTTGYGRPGGFKSEQATPELKDCGCEVCHGPGSLHVESQDPDEILHGEAMSLSQCETCHSKDRVETFQFKPLLHGGAH